MCRRAARMDQIADRFRLQQIELPVNHSSTGELARSCFTRTRLDRRRNHGRWHDEPSMGTHLEQILSGERVGGDVERRHGLIDRFACRVAYDASCGPARLCWDGMEEDAGKLSDPRS